VSIYYQTKTASAASSNTAIPSDVNNSLRYFHTQLVQKNHMVKCMSH